MKKLFVLTSRFPYPLDKGDKLRLFHQLKGLSASFEVHLVALNNERVAESSIAIIEGFCKSCNVIRLSKREQVVSVIGSIWNKTPFQVAIFWSVKAKKKVLELLKEIKPDLIHCHLIRTFRYAENLKMSEVSVDLMDAFGEGMQKRQRHTRNFIKRAIFNLEKHRLHQFEKYVISQSGQQCIISEQDRNCLKHEKKNQVHIIPNGVDFNQFFPKSLEKRFDLIFMGNLAYPPNVKAIEFFVSEIFPVILMQRPDTNFLIAGVNPTKNIRTLENERITVRSDFEDISDAMALAKLMVAPMVISIGLQNKIIQAMAMKIPCVVTSSANEPIKATKDHSIAVADLPEDFAKEVVMLLNDDDKREAMGNSAFNFVQTKYSWPFQNDKLIKMLEG